MLAAASAPDRNYTHAITERLALPANASYALVSTVAADLGMTSIFPPLANGGVLHVISQDLITNGRALGRVSWRPSGSTR